MGDGVKLPENERPPFREISLRLDSRIPRKIQSIFVVDLQNDCACNTEVYDTGLHRGFAFLSQEGPTHSSSSFEGRIPLPMLPELSINDIWNLLKLACDNAGNECGDFLFRYMLFNPKTSPSKLKESYETWCGKLSDWEVMVLATGPKYIDNWIEAPFVPEDCVYITPDPEFFGVISVNIDKFGAMCFPAHILKISV